MAEEKVRKSAITLEQVDEYLQISPAEFDKLWKQRETLTTAQLIALRYVKGMMEDQRYISDYLDRTNGKPVQKVVTKDLTPRDTARKLTTEELHERLRRNGIDPSTGLPTGESFEEPEE